jgi:hypothetical protein
MPERDVVLRTTADQEEIVRRLDRYNEAARLVNSGQEEQALAILDAELDSCGSSEICEEIRAFREKIAGWVARSQGVDRFNQAGELLDQLGFRRRDATDPGQERLDNK